MSSDCGIPWAFHITIFLTFFFQVMETPEKVFIDDTMIQYLNSKLDLNLSCAIGLSEPEFYGDWA